MAGNVLAPIIKGDTPRICTRVSSKTDQSMIARLKPKPTAVLLAHGTIGSFNLCVMENRFSEHQISIRRPHHIMQRVVRVFSPEAGQDALPEVSLAVTIRILNEGKVRHFRNVDPAVPELKRKRNVQIISKDG